MKVNVMDDVIEGTAKGRRVRVKMDHIEELTAVEKAKVGDCAKHLNGAKTEKNMVKYMEKEFASEGMTQVKFGKDFTSPTSHGIDGIFKDKLGNYHFVEAKSHFSDISKNTYGGKNYATKLGKPKMGDQMGNEWLMKYIDRIKDSDISKAEKEIMKLQLAGETAKKHVFIMSGADTAKGFTISQEFADDLGKVGIQQVHILNPA